MLVEDSAGVVAVADGLGGHPAGDLASGTAIASLAHTVSDAAAAPPSGDGIGRWLTESLQAAHAAVLEEASKDPERAGMATTVVLAQLHDKELWLAHVGDSRAYVLRDGGGLEQLTRDHGLGGYITQALGLDRGVSPDVTHIQMGDGDRLLLCTDGLTNMIDEPTIGRLLGDRDVKSACDALVDAALDAGGIDNITVIVVDP
jgi:protein phosphatase